MDFSQNDRRVVLSPSSVLLVAHNRSVASVWQDDDVVVLRVPRDAVPDADRLDRLGGALLTRQTPVMRLLELYARSVWTLAEEGDIPAVAGRHLAELAGLALGGLLGVEQGTEGRAPGLQAARLAAIREAVTCHFANPVLSVADVAASVGLSERAGYLVMEQAGVSFSDMVYGVRLDRARERLLGGYAGRLIDLAFDVGFSDLSHFNRRFRQRFGSTPGAMRRPT